MTWGYVTCDDLAEMYYNCVYRGIIPENGRCNALCNGGLPCAVSQTTTPKTANHSTRSSFHLRKRANVDDSLELVVQFFV